MVIYTVSYPPRLIPVSLVLPSLDDAPGNAPGPAPQTAPAAPTLNQVVKVLPWNSSHAPCSSYQKYQCAIQAVCRLYACWSTSVCMSLTCPELGRCSASSVYGILNMKHVSNFCHAVQHSLSLSCLLCKGADIYGLDAVGISELVWPTGCPGARTGRSGQQRDQCDQVWERCEQQWGFRGFVQHWEAPECLHGQCCASLHSGEARR